MTVRLAAAILATLPASNATAGQTSVNVLVSVNLISSSGVCSLLNGGAAVGVACGGTTPDPVTPVTPAEPPPWMTPGPQMPPDDGLGGQLPPVPPPIATPGPALPGGTGRPIPFPASPQDPSSPSQTPIAQPLQSIPEVLAGFGPSRDLRYVGIVGLVGRGFSLFSASAEITSWRVVSLDNGKYVELTIAW